MMPNIYDIPSQSTLGFRLKGSSIFYSCTVNTANYDKIVISIPGYQAKPLEINNKVELRVQSKDNSILYGGTISELLTDSLEIKITSRKDHVEKRKNIRLSCEVKFKYMEAKTQEEAWYTTYSIDMSPEGIRFYSARFHQEDDMLIFQFNIPDGYASRFLLVRGKYNPKNPGYRRYMVRVCYEGLSSKDSIDLIRYIYTNTKNK